MGKSAAGMLFILSLGGLSKQETAQRGNTYGIIGMLLAVLTVLVGIEAGMVSRHGRYAFAVREAAPRCFSNAIPKRAAWPGLKPTSTYIFTP